MTPRLVGPGPGTCPGAGATEGPEWFDERRRALHSLFTDDEVGYPCHFARQGETLGSTYYTYCTLDVGGRVPQAEIAELAATLRAFLALDRTPPLQRLSLLCVVGPAPSSSRSDTGGRHAADRATYWDILRRLSATDTSTPTETDPDAASWNFEFAGERLFSFGASPGFGQRRSRDLGPCLVLAFQPMTIFADMTGGTPLGRAAKLRIRQRLLDYDRVPLLADAGTATGPTEHKWKQYFPAVDGLPEVGSNPIGRAWSPPTYVVHEVRSSVDIDRDAWHSLSGVRANPFYTHDTLTAYERSRLGNQRAHRYLLVERDGRLVAGTALYLLQAQEVGSVLGLPELAHVGQTALLGHFPHCYDSIIPGIDTVPAEVVGRLMDGVVEVAAREGASVCGFMNVVSGSPTHQALAALPSIVTRTSSRRWYLDLTGLSDIDEYTARLGRATRRTLRAARRRARDLQVRTTVTTSADGDEHRRALDDAVEQCRSSADRHRSRYYPSTALAEFLRLRGDVHVVRIMLGDEVLAASICFLVSGVLHTWAGGAQYPRELNWSPNAVLLAAEIELGLQLGAGRVECGRSNDDYKARHGMSPVQLVTCLADVAQ
ncbi:MAG: GNAT family N-acetyltransferase [Nocardioides sp.]|uniref:GNAT family N-acetyltransferase n=1 Tax=Nocardioides sp. TaxID=35761 RepID=UPI0039E53F87